MERNAFLELLNELLELDHDTLKGPELLSGIDAWDSLAFLGFIALVDEKFGKIVSPPQLTKAQTVNDLIALAV